MRSNKMLNIIQRIKLRDFFAIILFFFLFPISMIYKFFLKIKKKPVWLICESKDTAGDNGYHLFKYIKEKHPEVNCYYAIDKKCKDYEKIKQYDNVIVQFGSLKHWIYYIAAEYNISSQKAGNPNAAVFYFLQVHGILKNKRIFLQHGITKDDMKWLYYNETKFKMFICGAKPEYEYIKEKFRYPEGAVQYTGFSRFDNLHNCNVNKKQIVVMPTWRDWLGQEKNILTKKENFTETNYFKAWNSVLNSKEIKEFIEKNDITMYFYPHLNMQKFIASFSKNSDNIKIVTKEQKDIQTLLKESALLITDYSSVFMDFAYMRKPIIYYQFDKEEYRQKQYAEGYFSYENNGFGPVVYDEKEIINKLKHYVENDYKIETIYEQRNQNFFVLHDQDNCKRIFEQIQKV